MTHDWPAQRQRLERLADYLDTDDELPSHDIALIRAALARIDAQERALEAAEAAIGGLLDMVPDEYHESLVYEDSEAILAVVVREARKT